MPRLKNKLQRVINERPRKKKIINNKKDLIPAKYRVGTKENQEQKMLDQYELLRIKEKIEPRKNNYRHHKQRLINHQALLAQQIRHTNEMPDNIVQTDKRIRDYMMADLPQYQNAANQAKAKYLRHKNKFNAKKDEYHAKYNEKIYDI